MAEYIDREEAKAWIANWLRNDKYWNPYSKGKNIPTAEVFDILSRIPAADVLSIPDGGIGEVSDGYHTFNGLYYQRMVLFATLVKQNKDKSWKSLRHEDGELCFGGGWFIVGIDTPDGSYTYHYEDNFWSMFDCQELPVAKHWDGHTEKDVTRLLSLADVQIVKHSKWKLDGEPPWYVRECPECNEKWFHWSGFSMPNYCPNCGAKMDGDSNG